MPFTYRVRARNTSADSENKIHDDAIAAEYGFRGGLVPGITVYAYMTVPVVERFGLEWLEHGTMNVKFQRPFYDAEDVLVTAEAGESLEPLVVPISASRKDGTVCATATATLNARSERHYSAGLVDYPEAPPPDEDQRAEAVRESFVAGRVLGSLDETPEVPDAALLEALDEKLPIYAGPLAVAHPFSLLRLSNQILMSNFKLGPWIHVSSDLVNRSAVRRGDRLSVRGRIRECFERKGHEYVVLDVLVVANGDRIAQQVRHTAIYRPRVVDRSDLSKVLKNS